MIYKYRSIEKESVKGVGTTQKKKLIGQILIEEGLIEEEKLQLVLKKQKESGKRLGELFLELKLITPMQLADVLALQGYPRLNLLEYQTLDMDLIQKVEQKVMREYYVVPFRYTNDVLYVVIADPLNYPALDHLQQIFSVMKVEVYIGSIDEIEQTLDKIFTSYDLEGDTAEDEQEDESRDLLIGDSPLVKFINDLVIKAINESASDIHFEPQVNKSMRVRFRIDGELIEKTNIPRRWRNQAVARLKIMASLDISKKLEPQDGEIRFKYIGDTINLRVNTMPTINGEKAVVRILGQGSSLISLQQINFSPEKYKVIAKKIKRKQGMILVTGPTGSGKSTTLYSIVAELNKPNVNIVTIENPVEIRMNGINQTQTSKKTDFANALRAILRQDPDIVMVGEIRDLETAEIAVRASLTGHLLLSTLHTNDAISVITRFIDMGIEPYLVADALELIISQRLVRKICPRCKIIDEEGLEQAKKMFPQAFGTVEVLYKGKGCSFCNGLGFIGRLAVQEIFEPTDITRNLIATKNIEKIRTEYMKDTIFEDAIQKVKAGLTTFGEIIEKISD